MYNSVKETAIIISHHLIIIIIIICIIIIILYYYYYYLWVFFFHHHNDNDVQKSSVSYRYNVMILDRWRHRSHNDVWGIIQRRT